MDDRGWAAVKPSIVVPLTDELDESIGKVKIPLRLLAAVPLLLLWVLGIFIAGGLIVFFHSQNSLGCDSHAYWLSAQHARLYDLPPLSRDAFLYSPAFADIVWPFAHLPWPVFGSLWAAAEIATFIWLLAPLGWRWGVPLLLLCTVETSVGNVYAFFALAVVLGIRRPSIWALPLLTKVSPGVAIVWFAVRKEWRHLATIAIVTFVIAALSFSLSPRLWLDWFRFLLITPRIPILWMPYRIGAGLLVAVVAAKSRRPWLLAPAMVLASPVLGLNSLTILVAIPRLNRTGVAERELSLDLK